MRGPATPDIGVPYDVRHSARAKRLQAVVRGGRIEIVVPRWARSRQVNAFVIEAAAWIAAKAAAQERSGTILPASCTSGETVLLEGRTLRLRVEPGSGRRPQVHLADELVVRLPAEPAATLEKRTRDALLSWLKERARAVATDHVATHAPRLGRQPRGVRIKAQKTLWGSCGRTGLINLNWRLIGAPPRVFEYLVVHELCHLEQRNHGPRFWRLVAELMPGFEAERAWLRDHGMRLG